MDMPNNPEIDAWLEAWSAENPNYQPNYLILTSERAIVTRDGVAALSVSADPIDLIVDGVGTCDITFTGDIQGKLNPEDEYSSSLTVNLDILAGTPIIVAGNSGTLTMTPHS